MDTETLTADVVILDAESIDADTGFGSEIAKTTAVTATTAVVVLAGIYAFNRLKPRAVALLARHKKDEPQHEVIETPIETPKNKKD